MIRIYNVIKIRPKIKSWEVICAFYDHCEALKERDMLQDYAKEIESKAIYIVQSTKLKGEMS